MRIQYPNAWYHVMNRGMLLKNEKRYIGGPWAKGPCKKHRENIGKQLTAGFDPFFLIVFCKQ